MPIKAEECSPMKVAMTTVAELYARRQRQTQLVDAHRFAQSLALQKTDDVQVAANIQLLKLLGKGSFGQVWQGKRNGTEDVVIKIANFQSSESNTKELVNVFLAEAAAQIIVNETDKKNKNLNLCKEVLSCALDMFISPDLDGIIVFPFKTPETLEKFIFKKDKLTKSINDAVYKLSIAERATESTVASLYLHVGLLQVVHDLLRDVKRLHEAGIAHLDLKPANILVSEEPSISNDKNTIIIDLGLACADGINLNKYENAIKKVQDGMSTSLKTRKPAGIWNAIKQQKYIAQINKIQKAIESAKPIDALTCIVDRGTAIYMSPFALESENKWFSTSLREDLYALGLIILEIMTQSLLVYSQELAEKVEAINNDDSIIDKRLEKAKIVQAHVTAYMQVNEKAFDYDVAAIIREFTSSRAGSLPNIYNAEKAIEQLIKSNRAKIAALVKEP